MSIPPIPAGLIQLLWFVRIVEAGSFTEAARRAGSSTSAMSKAVSRFEHSHGLRLLHRTTHSISLTDDGERLYQQARPLLKNLEHASDLLLDLGGKSATGRVRVSAPAAFARSCITPRLPEFLRAHPDIEIELQLDDTVTELSARGIDIAIRAGAVDSWPGHIATPLYTFPWIACATPEYLEAHGTPESPADLTRHDLIGYRNKTTGQIDTWQFVDPQDGCAHRYVPRTRHVFDDGQTAWSILRAGFGIGWAPAWLGLDDLRSGHVVEVLRGWRAPASPLSAVRLQRQLTPIRTRQVIDFISALPSAWEV